jgi:hypothetical protein
VPLLLLAYVRMANRADELEHGAYHPLDRGGRFAGGIVECGTNRLVVQDPTAPAPDSDLDELPTNRRLL